MYALRRRLAPPAGLLLLALALAATPGAAWPAAASSAALVRNINTTVEDVSYLPSIRSGLTVVGPLAFYQGCDLPHGCELWVTDGTAQGSRLVRDIRPGMASSHPLSIVAVGQHVFFTASTDGAPQPTLWMSDGTAAGTVAVDLAGQLDPATPYVLNILAAVSGRLLYEDSAGFWSLSGDGTNAVQLPGRPQSGTFRALGGALLYVASDATNGRELWATDGTPGGTFLVKDVNPSGDAFDSFDSPQLTVGAPWLYFLAQTGPFQFSLWRTNGTTAGTTQLVNLNAAQLSQLGELTAAGDTVFFRASGYTPGPGGTPMPYTTLWRFAPGDSSPAPMSASGLPASQLMPLGARVVFKGPDEHLWVSDGSAAGTVELAGAVLQNNPYPPAPTFELGGALYVVAASPAGNYELWRTDGTPAGTSLVREINPSGSAAVSSLFRLGNTIYFQATDGQRNGLWRSDGSAAGTTRVRDLDVAERGSLDSAPSGPRLTALGDRVFFPANDGASNVELWVSDGTAAGTTLVRDLREPGGSNPRDLSVLGDRLFFIATTSAGAALWASDGTAGGTTALQGAQPWPAGAQPYGLTRLGGRLYFFLDLGGSGYELWQSDGTNAGTARIAALPSNPFGGAPGDLTALGDLLFFAAGDRDHGTELWTSDGTAAGTRMLKEMRPSPDGSQPYELTAVGGRLYYFVRFGVSGRELWSSDGTEAGTTLVKSLGNTPLGSNVEPAGLVGVGQRVLFRAFDSAAGLELWASDGTAEGTVRLKDINPTPFNPSGPQAANGNSDPSALTVVGDRVLFAAHDGAHGQELWVSDGTADGTRLLRDINPGAAGSAVSSIVQISPGLALFGASSGPEGVELWQTDGTAAGTFQLHDLAPGALSSSPAGFTQAGERTFFSATDGASGMEPWVLAPQTDKLPLKLYLPRTSR